MEPRETANDGSSWVKRIVVAADGSYASHLGLEEVADIAKRLDSHVVVAHVRHMPAVALSGGVAIETLMQTLDEQEAAVRREAIRVLGGTGVDWELVVREGSPGDELVKLVEETDADLVIVGSNRHSSLRNFILGSTAGHLTAHSPAPVLVMRSRDRRPASALAMSQLN
jgi:nucleotide-binding universal stress UspA family protein